MNIQEIIDALIEHLYDTGRALPREGHRIGIVIELGEGSACAFMRLIGHHNIAGLQWVSKKPFIYRGALLRMSYGFPTWSINAKVTDFPESEFPTPANTLAYKQPEEPAR